MTVVGDTSPFRALHHLGLLDLLPTQFSRILVPPAVVRELENPSTAFVRIPIASLPFLEMTSPTNSAVVANLRKSLDPGESEAIALALENPGAAVLIDEAAGRRAAIQAGLKVIGTAGILLQGKRAGQVPAIVPLLDRLSDELGFFIAPAFRNYVRMLAGE